jgi:hypothetical protein
VLLGLGMARPGPAQAAEKGTGFYLLGSKGPGAGILPQLPGIYFENDFYYYSGDLGGGKRLPTGGDVAVGLRGQVALEFPLVLVVLPEEIAGGRLGLTFGLPVGWAKSSADVKLSGPLLGSREKSVSDTIFTVGDPVAGATLGWDAGNFHWNIGTLVNIPIGDYQEGELANIAFHRWAMDWTVAGTYFDPATGWDFSGAAGVTFNGENPATDYKTGTEFHLEGSISKQFNPAFEAGILGYYYHQITGDSGDGAVLGPFKGQVAAIGAQIGYNFKIGQVPMAAHLKYFHEFDAKNRAEGDAVLATIAMPLSIFKPAGD